MQVLAVGLIVLGAIGYLVVYFRGPSGGGCCSSRGCGVKPSAESAEESRVTTSNKESPTQRQQMITVESLTQVAKRAKKQHDSTQ